MPEDTALKPISSIIPTKHQKNSSWLEGELDLICEEDISEIDISRQGTDRPHRQYELLSDEAYLNHLENSKHVR